MFAIYCHYFANCPKYRQESELTSPEPEDFFMVAEKILDANFTSNLQYVHICLFPKNIRKYFPLSKSDAPGKSLMFML